METFIGPNVHQDILKAQKALRTIRSSKFIFRYRVSKTGRILKLKKYKFMKKFRKIK